MSATGRIRGAGRLLAIPIAAVALAACGGSTKTVTSTTSKTVTNTTTKTVPDGTTPATTPANTTTDPAGSEANLTTAQKNAVKAAQNYLELKGFSKQGLINQLSSSAGDGYEVKDATVAVNTLKVNWNEQAARAAKEYLKVSPFSCSGLVRQLSSSAGDKFTVAQAQYGAKKAGVCSSSSSSSSSSSPSGSPTAAASAAAALPNHCSRGVSTTRGLPCDLASNVFYEYHKAVQNGKDTTALSVWSPGAKQYRTTNCSKGTGVITCHISGTDVPNAQVQITQDALDAYTSQDASAYARNHDVGPRG